MSVLNNVFYLLLYSYSSCEVGAYIIRLMLTVFIIKSVSCYTRYLSWN